MKKVTHIVQFLYIGLLPIQRSGRTKICNCSPSRVLFQKIYLGLFDCSIVYMYIYSASLIPEQKRKKIDTK